MSVVTRFPPSPTGYLHIGGARTALFSWLYARHHGGRFVFRVEDTDRERSTEESVQAIFEAMKWLGLEYDDGPYFQTERMDRYAQVIDLLLERGQAYRCYCSREELQQMRDSQRAAGAKPRYDGRCRGRTEPVPGVPPVVRFKNPQDGKVVIEDQVKGRIVISNEELDDLIIARSDGTPTYNLTVVVDDMDMGVTHVIRGDDHVNNTPRQVNILQALGATVPVYAHVPMILGADGKRMSKRHGAVSVTQYRDDGYLPQALLNYLVRLGWSHGDQELFSREEMIELFDIKGVHRNAAVFDPDKLLWLNYEHIKAMPVADLKSAAASHFEQLDIDIDKEAAADAVIALNQERSKTLVELVARSAFFFKDVTEYDAKAAKKNFRGDALQALTELEGRLGAVSPWQAEPIHHCVQELAEALGLPLGKVAQPLRVAVSGTAVSPPIDATLEVLGRTKTLQRVAAARRYMQALPAGVAS